MPIAGGGHVRIRAVHEALTDVIAGTTPRRAERHQTGRVRSLHETMLGHVTKTELAKAARDALAPLLQTEIWQTVALAGVRPPAVNDNDRNLRFGREDLSALADRFLDKIGPEFSGQITENVQAMAIAAQTDAAEAMPVLMPDRAITLANARAAGQMVIQGLMADLGSPATGAQDMLLRYRSIVPHLTYDYDSLDYSCSETAQIATAREALIGEGKTENRPLIADLAYCELTIRMKARADQNLRGLSRGDMSCASCIWATDTNPVRQSLALLVLASQGSHVLRRDPCRALVQILPNAMPGLLEEFGKARLYRMIVDALPSVEGNGLSDADRMNAAVLNTHLAALKRQD